MRRRWPRHPQSQWVTQYICSLRPHICCLCGGSGGRRADHRILATGMKLLWGGVSGCLVWTTDQRPPTEHAQNVRPSVHLRRQRATGCFRRQRNEGEPDNIDHRQ